MILICLGLIFYIIYQKHDRKLHTEFAQKVFMEKANEAEELKKIVERQKEMLTRLRKDKVSIGNTFKPKDGQDYYFWDFDSSNIIDAKWTTSCTDIELYYIGNCFESWNECNKQSDIVCQKYNDVTSEIDAG